MNFAGGSPEALSSGVFAMKFCQSIAAAALMTVVSTSFVEAATVSYTSSVAFQTALTGQTVVTEGYESPAVNSTIANGGTLNGLTYSFSNGLPGRIDNVFNKFGAQSLASNSPAGFFFRGDSITVSFGAAITAFGIFFNLGQSPAGAVYATTNLGNTALGSGTYDSTTFYFVGLTSDTAFTSVTFGSTLAAVSGFNVDNLSYVVARAVPEPGSLALASLALFGAAVARRRRP